jgi:tRNA dimethylallyltransferase
VHWLDSRDPHVVERALDVVARADSAAAGAGSAGADPGPRRTLGS